MTNANTSNSRPRRKLLIGTAIGLVVVIAAVAGFLVWFFKDDAPDKVTLEDAVAEVKDSTTTTAATGSTDASADTTATTTASSGTSTGIDGTWKPDTTTGTFDYKTATGTFVGFRIDEELQGIGKTEAVGRTGDVSGSMTIEGTKLTAATFDVDLTTITTDQSRRDDKVQSALNTSEHPTATFTLTSPVDLGADAASGDAVKVEATGDLTVNGVTKSVTFTLEAQLVDSTIVVVGDATITFSDFDVEVPSAPIVLSVADTGTVELKLLLVKG
jgi:polyisoprenoid-binding protein YceI